MRGQDALYLLRRETDFTERREGSSSPFIDEGEGPACRCIWLACINLLVCTLTHVNRMPCVNLLAVGLGVGLGPNKTRLLSRFG